MRRAILLPTLITTLASALPSSSPSPLSSPTTPSSPSLSPREDACAGDPSTAGYCTPISYTDTTTTTVTTTVTNKNTTASAPSTSDCQQTCRSILGDAGDWGVDFAGQPAGYRDDLYLGACGFGVARETDADAAGFAFSVHNQDILDVVRGSIDRFAGSHDGRVSAEGTMECQGHVVRWFVG
ncbi:hypothetical protein M426DRAFT_320599 [Hypoxylon sp. CI-4A]|nr:hypothetical protein M426DRAFT_320599 [Hypoxylon sp. CI-4A]